MTPKVKGRLNDQFWGLAANPVLPYWSWQGLLTGQGEMSQEEREAVRRREAIREAEYPGILEKLILAPFPQGTE